MTNDLIKVRNAGYAKYEELLLKRDQIRKEAFQWEMEYTRVFGELIIEVFAQKIRCIEKRKSIEYCQAMINHGKIIDPDDMAEYLAETMTNFNNQLQDMIKEQGNLKNSTILTEHQVLELKRIYRRIAKQIHPDMSPKASESILLQDLWQRTQITYNCNDIDGIREIEVLVNKALNELGLDDNEIEIENLDIKILELEDEIEKIKGCDPYQYKFLLADEDAVEEKKTELRAELEEYREYFAELEKLFQEIAGRSIKTGCHLN